MTVGVAGAGIKVLLGVNAERSPACTCLRGFWDVPPSLARDSQMRPKQISAVRIKGRETRRRRSTSLVLEHSRESLQAGVGPNCCSFAVCYGNSNLQVAGTLFSK